MSGQDLNALVNAARMAQQRGELTAASQYYAQAIALQPDSPQLRNADGMVALAIQDYSRAAEQFLHAIKADPAASVLRINLATAYRGLGDNQREREALVSVLDLDQANLTANLRLAELHEKLHEKGDAMRRWTAVLGIAQSLPDTTPEISDLIATAQSHLIGHSAALGQILSDGLSDVREGSNDADTRRFDVCMDGALGKRRIYTNECAGLHFPFLPADEFFERRHFPWLETIEAKTEAITKEFRTLWEKPDDFVPYVAMEDGTPQNKWSPLDHSLDWSTFFLWRHGVRDDAACARCPETTKAIESLPICYIPGRSPTVFFSVLRPRTRLPAHTGVTNVRSIVHVPLIIPDGCGFRVGGESRPWQVGSAFAFDDTIEHEAWNDSDEPRAVLIFDVWNPYLKPKEQEMLQRFFEVSNASSYGQSNNVD